MMQLKASKDSSRSFQTSSEINFLINARKSLPTSGQIFNTTFLPKNFITKHNPLPPPPPRAAVALRQRSPSRHHRYRIPSRRPKGQDPRAAALPLLYDRPESRPLGIRLLRREPRPPSYGMPREPLRCPAARARAAGPSGPLSYAASHGPPPPPRRRRDSCTAATTASDSKDMQQQSKALNNLTYHVEDRQLDSSQVQSVCNLQNHPISNVDSVCSSHLY